MDLELLSKRIDDFIPLRKSEYPRDKPVPIAESKLILKQITQIREEW
jgi:hypothetical protein